LPFESVLPVAVGVQGDGGTFPNSPCSDGATMLRSALIDANAALDIWSATYNESSVDSFFGPVLLLLLFNASGETILSPPLHALVSATNAIVARRLMGIMIRYRNTKPNTTGMELKSPTVM